MNMKKRLVFVLLAVVMILSIPFDMVEARSPERNIKIWIDDFYIMSDVHPFVENSRTFVPIRFIAEELGYKVDWNLDRREVSIESNESEAILKIGAKEVLINGETIYLDLPAQLKKERTFVPFRLVAELFGEEVEYDSLNKVAIIGDDYEIDTYYPLKYYLDNKNPFITTYKVNFLEYIVRFSDGRVINLASDEEILNLVDEEGLIHESVDFDIEVEDDKQIHDKYYVAPIKSDHFVGTWYGTGTIGKYQGENNGGYVDAYTYIEKIGDNKYTVTKRWISPDGSSEAVAVAYASYDEENEIFVKERGHKNLKRTGEFNNITGYNYQKLKVENFNYMYLQNKPGLYYKKY